MRTKIDWRSASKENYKDFCRKHPSISITSEKWRDIIYGFSESFRDYILETGEKARLPFGFGEFSIIKKKKEKFKTKDGKEYINLSIDFQKTREKGKIVYHMNYHSDGYSFGWQWFKRSSVIKYSKLWYFKAARPTSRLLAHYIKVNKEYQQLYKEWKV